MSVRRVAIIGGGYGGMAAAIEATSLGAQATVFETAKILGGRARRIEYRGTTLDNGQHILSGAYSELLRLMALVGVGERAVRRVPLTLTMPPHFSLRAPKLPAPFHMAVALLRASGLTWGERIALAKMIRALKAQRFQVNPSLTVAALLAQHAQSTNLIHYFWQPLTISALNTPIHTASAQVLANILRDTLASGRAASDLLLPQVDLSALFPDPAARWLAAHGGVVHAGKRVTAITPASLGLRVVAEDISDVFDTVILAVGPHQLDEIALPIPGPAAFAYEPIYTVYLKYPVPVPLAHPMLGRPHGVTQWWFDRAALSPIGEQTQGLIAGVISASGAHQALSNDEIAKASHRELTELVGTLPEPSWHKVIAEKFATFACTTGLHRPAAETSHAQIFLAGDYVANDYPATLEGAVRNGTAAAKLACAAIESARKISPPSP